MSVLISLFMAATVVAPAEQLQGELKAATMLSVMFFFGRVDAAFSPADLEKKLEQQAAAMKGQPLGPLLQQCGQFMEGRGKVLEAIGARLEAKERVGRID